MLAYSVLLRKEEISSHFITMDSNKLKPILTSLCFQMIIILDFTRTVNEQKILKLVRKQVKQKSEVI